MPWTVYNSDGQILQGSSTLADDAVTTAKILNLAVTNAKLADDAVDSDEIAAGAIDLAHMSVNSIDSDQYVDGSIDLAHMSVNSIDSDQYVDGSIDRVHLVADIIDGTKIDDDVINSEHYVAGSIDLEHMASQSVDEDNLYISNAGSNGEFLSKQSGNNGGLTWAAAGGGPTEATQSDMEDLGTTNANRYVSPEVVNYHPGVAKAWGNFEQLGTHAFTDSYNFEAGITDRAQGKSDLVITTDFSSAEYSAVMGSDAYMTAYGSGVSKTAGTINIINTDTGGTPQDTGDFSIALFGDQ